MQQINGGLKNIHTNLYGLKYFLFHSVQQNKTPILECVRRLVLKTDTLRGPLRCA
jgi:hypothetical protein